MASFDCIDSGHSSALRRGLAIPWVLAIVSVRKFRWLALLPPDFLPGPLRMSSKLAIPIFKVSVDCRLCVIYRFIIAVVDDSARHAAEDRLDHVQELKHWPATARSRSVDRLPDPEYGIRTRVFT